MPIAEGTQAFKTVEAEYDFAVDGGAVGTINMRGIGIVAAQVPQGAVILGGYVDVLTPFTSGGAGTAAVQAQSAGDLVAGAAVSGAPWSTAGLKSVVPAFSGATAIKTTAARNLQMVIGTAALTAGKCRVVVMYR